MAAIITMKPARISGLAAIVFCVLALINPEDLLTQLNNQLKLYNSENPSTSLFLHLDKSVYSQNEDIWFKAYVLDGEVIDNNVLYVRLTDEKKQLMLSEQFPMYDIRAHGEMLLPDTLKDGTYYLYAYTDRMINFKESDIFVQTIKVQKNVAKRMEATAAITDTANIRRGKNIEVVVKLKEGINLQKGVRGIYEIIDGKKIIKNGRITTNLFGEATINFAYPQIADESSLRVRVVFNKNSDYAELELNLPHESNPVKLNFFPEGGRLVNGFTSKLLVEALDINKYPVTANLILEENNREIKRFKTNQYGTGSVVFRPISGASYTIKYLNSKKESISYPLQISDRGYGLRIKKEGQRILATIANNGESGKVFLGIRTLDEVLLLKPLSIAAGDSVRIPMLFKDMPKEVVDIVVLDDSLNVKCERLMLNNPAQEDYKVTLSTQQQNYGTRKKVTVNLNVNGPEGQPAAANFSVAVVEKSRIDPNVYRNILNTYYYRFLDGSNCNRFVSESIEKDIDDLLITKRWLNSSTQQIVGYKSKGAPPLLANTGGVTGSVEYKVKRAPKLEKLVIISKEKGVIFNVNADNTFSIRPESLLSSRGNKWSLKQSVEFYTNYQIKFNNPDIKFDKSITAGEALFVPRVFNAFGSNKPVEVTRSPTFLNAVVIKEKSANLDKSPDNIRTIGCNAYICRNNILNCPNHRSDMGVPEEGRVYQSANGPVVYRCRTTGEETMIKNITYPKEFMLTDFDNEKIDVPAYETTLYWNPNLNAPDGKSSFSFFSNDLKADFLIIAQGLDVNTLKPLFGQTGFSVK